VRPEADRWLMSETKRIGYGAMRLTGPDLWGDYPDRAAAIELLREAVEAGVNLIDTADVYGPHTNELLIRDALFPYVEGLTIATKGGFVRGGRDVSTIEAIGNANYLRQCVQLSARRLGVERIDLYYLHSGLARDASFADQVGTLAALRDEGLIDGIGLSNVTVEQLAEARRITAIAAVTAHYNIADRAQAALLEAAVAEETIFAPWQPVSLIAPGVRTDTSGSERMRRIAERHGATVPQVALAWLLARSPAVRPLPATTSVAHLRENLAAEDLHLTADDLAALS
jgi:pyridoxine 4-dehydrogenase